MTRPIWLLLLVAGSCGAQTADAGLPGVGPELRFESCPAVEIDVQSRPWLSKPLLARLSVSGNGTLQNIGVAQSSGITAVDESFFAWLAACRFGSLPSGPVPGTADLLVAVRVQSPDALAAGNAASRGLGDCPAPAYPSQATRRNLQGTTTVNLFVGHDGAFVAGSVVRSSGHAELDYAALAHLVSCPRAWPEGASLATTGSTFRAEYRWTIR